MSGGHHSFDSVAIRLKCRCAWLLNRDGTRGMGRTISSSPLRQQNVLGWLWTCFITPTGHQIFCGALSHKKRAISSCAFSSFPLHHHFYWMFLSTCNPLLVTVLDCHCTMCLRGQIVLPTTGKNALVGYPERRNMEGEQANEQ